MISYHEVQNNLSQEEKSLFLVLVGLAAKGCVEVTEIAVSEQAKMSYEETTDILRSLVMKGYVEKRMVREGPFRFPVYRLKWFQDI